MFSVSQFLSLSLPLFYSCCFCTYPYANHLTLISAIFLNSGNNMMQKGELYLKVIITLQLLLMFMLLYMQSYIFIAAL